MIYSKRHSASVTQLAFAAHNEEFRMFTRAELLKAFSLPSVVMQQAKLSQESFINEYTNTWEDDGNRKSRFKYFNHPLDISFDLQQGLKARPKSLKLPKDFLK